MVPAKTKARAVRGTTKMARCLHGAAVLAYCCCLAEAAAPAAAATRTAGFSSPAVAVHARVNVRRRARRCNSDSSPAGRTSSAVSADFNNNARRNADEAGPHVRLRASAASDQHGALATGAATTRQSDDDDEGYSYGSSNDELYRRELFSVAPMMGHTNRHYRHYFRLLGTSRTFLYTEMVPSAQIVWAYRRLRSAYFGRTEPTGDGEMMHDIRPEEISAEEIVEVILALVDRPELEYRSPNDNESKMTTLSDLIGLSGQNEHPVVIQLGGRDPETLRLASAIGSALGEYREVNLNCGCPSNAVGGRSGGAALMKEPDLVARCVEAMNEGVASVHELKGEGAGEDGGSIADGSGVCNGGAAVGMRSGRRREPRRRPPPGITVKHRLGVRDAATFDAKADRRKRDDEAYEECRRFVGAVAMGGAVTKCHVHARLGLLGEFGDAPAEKTRQKLWVPGLIRDGTHNNGIGDGGGKREKIDHKREQERARRRAREATIKNRDVPPLRPDVVNRLADAFPDLEFVANGGIQTLEDAERIVDNGLLGGITGSVSASASSKGGFGGGTGGTRVVGAMVGRAAINHPCAFASADRLWESRAKLSASARAQTPRRRTRGGVLRDYIQYCDREEDRLANLGASRGSIDALRRRLVAVPFHLFVGEDGNDAFQRSVKKLTARKSVGLIKASSILSGAASFLPETTMNKCVDDFVPWKDVKKFEGAFRRSSAMQRIVY